MLSIMSHFAELTLIAAAALTLIIVGFWFPLLIPPARIPPQVVSQEEPPNNTINIETLVIIAGIIPAAAISLYWLEIFVTNPSLYIIYAWIWSGIGLLFALGSTSIITEILKAAVARPRPRWYTMSSAEDPKYRWDAYRSFPSAHASLAFAGLGYAAFTCGWLFAIPAFVIASFVAASRVIDGMHYISDVIFGATIGLTAAGLVFIRHSDLC